MLQASAANWATTGVSTSSTAALKHAWQETEDLFLLKMPVLYGSR